MSELQKIVLGVLSTTHPEIAKLRSGSVETEASAKSTAPMSQRPRSRNKSTLHGVIRALKFGFAALVTGSRAIPLGDNGCLIRELGIYGARLQR